MIFNWVCVAKASVRVCGADGVLRLAEPSAVRTVLVAAVSCEPAGATARSRPGWVAARAIAAFQAALFSLRVRPTSTTTRTRAVEPARLESAEADDYANPRQQANPPIPCKCVLNLQQNPRRQWKRCAGLCHKSS